ncbi:hypothetical protein TNIN_72261 [Trichonephila inaurata madagascariensis]|uniref:Uncharacterized protein n=1 Tax=Trichonephila inaurata madagascariensis TaxID=2747483 RepID=A0A8X6YXS1_9ARAC|nr:hypothetical protein TNIN_72261 [Trichonephila inaurata madagascariensis]
MLEDATDVEFACFDVYLGCVSTHSRRRGDSVSEVGKMSFWSWWKSERFEDFPASNNGGYRGKLMHQNFAKSSTLALSLEDF